MKATVSLTLAVSFMLAANLTLAAPEKVYKWADEKGLIHYSERPPLGTDTEVLKPEVGHSEPVNYGSPSDNKSKEGKKVDKQPNGDKGALKDPERCDSARKNLETLKTYARIKIKGDDGEYRFLTPDEQQQKNDEASKAIEESCE
jgi:hypothetical protein